MSLGSGVWGSVDAMNEDLVVKKAAGNKEARWVLEWERSVYADLARAGHGNSFLKCHEEVFIGVNG